MFRGSHTTTVDEKGRLKIPAEFKATLDEEFGPDFFVTSRDGQRVLVYPFSEWRKIEEKLAALPSMNKSKQKFLDRTMRWGGTARIDPQGRVLIPARLRESAGMKGEVEVVGYLEHIEVWKPERLDQHLEQEPMTEADEKTLSDLNI
jgi:MraZ protein